MKFKTTQKTIKANYTNIICVGYCDLQHLLTYKNPIAYTVRREGWGADIYEVNSNTVIVTGYAPFGNVHVDYETVRKFDDRAKEILYETRDYRPESLDWFIEEFIEEVTANGK